MPAALTIPPAADDEYSCWLSRHPRSGSTARRLLREFLALHASGERFLDAAESVLAELVNNAVQHSRTAPGRLLLIRFEHKPDHLRLEVHDAGRTRPALRAASPDDENGRGLRLVQELSIDWGWCPREGGIGKVVWAAIAPEDRDRRVSTGNRPCGQGTGCCPLRDHKALYESSTQPVLVEIEGICAPATFPRLPEALAALWRSLQLLPLGEAQAATMRDALTHPRAVGLAAESIRRDGRLDLSFRMNGRLHSALIRPAEPPPTQE
ncbi:ATP-binding protein [Kitasatospora sp. NPDC008115]|uniref:ATP-binding protein n=1 Tax=Kitasatospora sp. NPDC008115 TaxID=3364022 RepID=UPI0036F0C226